MTLPTLFNLKKQLNSSWYFFCVCKFHLSFVNFEGSFGHKSEVLVKMVAKVSNNLVS